MKMSKSEREIYLSEPHVGILSVPRIDRGPLSAPIWYDYKPGEQVTMFIDKLSMKADYLRSVKRISLCVQKDDPPYVYVSVEGPFQIGEADKQMHLQVAIRYLGEERGQAWMDQFGYQENSYMVSLEPEFWLTKDYRKRRF